MSASRSWARVRAGALNSARVFVSDLGNGLMVVSHSSLAVIGLAVLAAAFVIGGRADVRGLLEERALDWLVSRQEARSADPSETLDTASLLGPGDISAVDRATAIDPSELNRQQAVVAQWLSRRYRVAPEPVGRLVQEAWSLGQRVGLEPTLILAIVAIESSFNPFAQSSVGAQGLMQVMTRVHDDKYVAFGGNHAAFDPLTNLRVGVQVLKTASPRQARSRAACATTSAPPIWPATAATPSRSWPSRNSCSSCCAAARCPPPRDCQCRRWRRPRPQAATVRR